MIFQSKYVNYAMMVRKSYWKISPDGEKELVPGLIATFSGPQRLFDSEKAQEQFDWSDADRKRVETKIVKSKRYGTTIFPAFGQELPAYLAKVARWKQPEKKLRCQYIWTEDGQMNQCSEEPTAGREFCVDHDPQQTQIIRGALTSNQG